MLGSAQKELLRTTLDPQGPRQCRDGDSNALQPLSHMGHCTHVSLRHNVHTPFLRGARIPRISAFFAWDCGLLDDLLEFFPDDFPPLGVPLVTFLDVASRCLATCAHFCGLPSSHAAFLPFFALNSGRPLPVAHTIQLEKTI